MDLFCFVAKICNFALDKRDMYNMYASLANLRLHNLLQLKERGGSDVRV